MTTLPILEFKNANAPSVFQPANLLREARRQRGLDHAEVPAICLLDPDGDMVRYLRRTGRAQPVKYWACYHTEMWLFEWDGIEMGVVGCAVGAPFAVLLAEQMFASGCRFLISVTSSGQITPVGEPPYFILIDRALRDEGTSYHYLSPSRFAEADPMVLEWLAPLVGNAPVTVHQGATWTTDAPYRETEHAIVSHRAAGILAVEMEAAALYAFSRARGFAVACFAHVTNTMAQSEGDFEKGEADGALEALALVAVTARYWLTAIR
ncbi:MAG: purine or other phosphorylase family 1 [Stygiobacter sp.]|nr:MAG: purine or other phosphorylase family 1 [Stygiobacter sp.]